MQLNVMTMSFPRHISIKLLALRSLLDADQRTPSGRPHPQPPTSSSLAYECIQVRVLYPAGRTNTPGQSFCSAGPRTRRRSSILQWPWVADIQMQTTFHHHSVQCRRHQMQVHALCASSGPKSLRHQNSAIYKSTARLASSLNIAPLRRHVIASNGIGGKRSGRGELHIRAGVFESIGMPNTSSFVCYTPRAIFAQLKDNWQ